MVFSQETVLYFLEVLIKVLQRLVQGLRGTQAEHTQNPLPGTTADDMPPCLGMVVSYESAIYFLEMLLNVLQRMVGDMRMHRSAQRLLFARRGGGGGGGGGFPWGGGGGGGSGGFPWGGGGGSSGSGGKGGAGAAAGTRQPTTPI